MKITLTYAALVFILLGCSKQQMMTFDLDNAIYIFKDPQNPNRDSLTYSFAIKPSTLMTDTVFVPVRIIGAAKPFARAIAYAEIAESSTAQAASYTLLPAVIPADSFTGYLPIKVMRTAELKLNEENLWLRLQNSKDLQVGVSNQLDYLIKLNDYLTRPSSWSINYFGSYSQVKYKILIQETGYSTYEGLGLTEIRALTIACKNYLIKYEQEHGYLYDEFGARVVFP